MFYYQGDNSTDLGEGSQFLQRFGLTFLEPESSFASSILNQPVPRKPTVLTDHDLAFVVKQARVGVPEPVADWLTQPLPAAATHSFLIVSCHSDILGVSPRPKPPQVGC